MSELVPRAPMLSDSRKPTRSVRHPMAVLNTYPATPLPPEKAQRILERNLAGSDT